MRARRPEILAWLCASTVLSIATMVAVASELVR